LPNPKLGEFFQAEYSPSASLLRLLRGFLASPLASLVLQYVLVGRDVVRLHKELLDYIEKNTMPGLIEIEDNIMPGLINLD
jgi:hypothetical protein